MAIYLCYECDTLVDGDYHPSEEHPRKPDELVCDDCMTELEYRMEVNGEDYIKPRIAFDKNQRIEIAKMEKDNET